MSPRPDLTPRRAYGLVLGAYVLWGFLPLYWPHLGPAGLAEILAHRAVWSLVAAVVAVVLLRRRRRLVALFATRRTRGLLTVSGVALLVNWLVFPLTGFGLALSWAVYGLVKKVAGVGAVESLPFETLLIAPWGALYLASLSTQGEGRFTSAGPLHALLLVGASLAVFVVDGRRAAGAPRAVNAPAPTLHAERVA